MDGKGDEFISTLANLNGVSLAGIEDDAVSIVLERFRLTDDQDGQDQVAAFNSAI